MTRRTPVRIAVAAGAALLAIFAAGDPAFANVSDVPINPGNVPTTAQNAPTHQCSPQLGGGPFADKDVWVFNLPDSDRDFVSIVASFDTNGDGSADVSVTIEAGAADGDDIVRQGTSKAWVVTTAGWTLTGATAVVTGDPPQQGKPLQFVLTHTCPASGQTPTPSPSPTPSTGDGSSGGGGGSSGGGDGSGSSSSGGSGGSLPTTGQSLGWLIGLGLLLVGGGAGLVVLRRRRDMIFRA
jgi:LPXTG-motif cell wall-anchored protein